MLLRLIFNIINMEAQYYYSEQIGLMFSWGINYEKRKYITIEIPFLVIQIFWDKRKKKFN